VAAILWFSGARHGLALVTWGVGAFVVTIIATEFWKGTKARARIEGEGYVPALFHLVTRNRRRWGGYIVHVGIAMIFMAFAGAAYNVDERFHVVPGDVVEVASPLGHTYTLTYEGLSTARQNGMRNLLWQAIATVSVDKDGETIDVLLPEKRQYTTQEPGSPPMTEIDKHSTFLEDLYLILSAMDDAEAVVYAGDSNAQGIDLQVLVKPLVNWIWLGCLILVGGAIIALWPSVDRRKEQEAPSDAATEAAPAAATG
jgi:cytochrome c-type biogenesis protein CcmF